MSANSRVIKLTPKELGALVEAVRLAQEISREGTGHPVAELSRVQRKLKTERADR